MGAGDQLAVSPAPGPLLSAYRQPFPPLHLTLCNYPSQSCRSANATLHSRQCLYFPFQLHTTMAPTLFVHRYAQLRVQLGAVLLQQLSHQPAQLLGAAVVGLRVQLDDVQGCPKQVGRGGEHGWLLATQAEAVGKVAAVGVVVVGQEGSWQLSHLALCHNGLTVITQMPVPP